MGNPIFDPDPDSGVTLDDLDGFFSDTADWFSSVGSALGSFLNWFNPTSDSFFLKAAFIADDSYFETRYTTFKNSLASWLGFDSYVTMIEQFQGVSAVESDFTKSVNIYGVGTVTGSFLDTSPFQSQALWIQGVIRGSMFLGLIIFNINNVFKLLNRSSSFSDGSSEE